MIHKQFIGTYLPYILLETFDINIKENIKKKIKKLLW